MEEISLQKNLKKINNYLKRAEIKVLFVSEKNQGNQQFGHVI